MNEEKGPYLFDLLDPIQLGFVYESLLKNANEDGLNSVIAKPYLNAAEAVKDAIDSNIGFEDYEKNHQVFCKKLADYDGRIEPR
jgi:hypothetical protein